MSKAYKCDRCGEFYTEEVIDAVEKYYNKSINIKRCELNFAGYEQIDLCANCLDDLFKFLSPKTKNKE